MLVITYAQGYICIPISKHFLGKLLELHVETRLLIVNLHDLIKVGYPGNRISLFLCVRMKIKLEGKVHCEVKSEGSWSFILRKRFEIPVKIGFTRDIQLFSQPAFVSLYRTVRDKHIFRYLFRCEIEKYHNA